MGGWRRRRTPLWIWRCQAPWLSAHVAWHECVALELHDARLVALGFLEHKQHLLALVNVDAPVL